jgi:hypothetical protein
VNKKKLILHVLTVLVLLVTCTSLAHAQATRTWVSGVGDDANPCSRTAPCKTFAGAISKTATGGEINVLDPGGFGGVTITKSITITSEGFEAGVLVSGTNAIIVNAGAAANVVLRGLDIEGLGTGLSGIRVLSVGNLYIENCTINAFSTGIDVQPTAAGTEQVFITDTIVRHNGSGVTGGGIFIAPAAGVNVKASLDNVRMENNVFGIKVQDRSTVGIQNSVAAGNAFAGFSAVQTGTGAISMVVDHSMSVNNATGVQSNSATAFPNNAIVRIANVTVTGNATGLAVVGTGQLVSFKTNNVDGNGTNGAPTSSPGPI